MSRLLETRPASTPLLCSARAITCRNAASSKAIIGLSGGIDSALTAVIAADAVGPENVIGVGMPGPYSSQGSIDDARALAKNLGIRFELLSINPAYEAYRQTLREYSPG